MLDEFDHKVSSPASGWRSLIALLLPPGAAFLVSIIFGVVRGEALGSGQAASAVLLSTVAITSWLLGLRWYSLSGMGIRGGRALTAGLGFASLLWIIFIVLRFIFVGLSPSVLQSRPPDAGRTYLYLLLFEAFATQVWTFGLIFRAVSDWRGGITGAVVSGLVFGLTAALLFQESYTGSISSMLYFIAWGVLYGLIRLRTGSFLGTTIVQSVQSFTSWVVLAPNAVPDPARLNNLYLTATIAYMIIGWRLWPKSEADYRI